MCGKNLISCLALPTQAGSPPRVREKPSGRFTHWRRSKDHPRVCGKNFRPTVHLIHLWGSPPRVREKQIRFCPKNDFAGITPACAGKTNNENGGKKIFGDHPRVCGKNLSPFVVGSGSIGSPPRVREKLNTYHKTASKSGITPACAGKTDTYSTKQYYRRDHPRVCGKNTKRSQ